MVYGQRQSAPLIVIIIVVDIVNILLASHISGGPGEIRTRDLLDASQTI